MVSYIICSKNKRDRTFHTRIYVVTAYKIKLDLSMETIANA